ncbi:unnamed protein product [Leptosia nina]|uniref:Uncharacterized protein n=1 Tax=Leptosia nina TaxID=320188 RepID=A0AAV1JU15_9NEOP
MNSYIIEQYRSVWDWEALINYTGEWALPALRRVMDTATQVSVMSAHAVHARMPLEALCSTRAGEVREAFI